MLALIRRLLEIFPAIWAVLYKDKKGGNFLPCDHECKNSEDLKAPLEDMLLLAFHQKRSQPPA